jgi:DNA-binding SARP family transcriptional activator
MSPTKSGLFLDKSVVRSATEAHMEFRVLGPVEASSGGHLLRLGGPQQHALLAYLLLHANTVVSADRMLDELWAEPPRGGVAALRTQVSRLRRHIGHALETAGRGYLLRVQPGELDLDRFRELLAQAGETFEPGRRSELLHEADELWRGEALSGLDAPFAARESAALEELRLAALEDRLEADLERGLNGGLTSELAALVARYPLRERLRGQLILALYRSGRQAEALEAYHDTRRMLDEELGLEPSPTLRELERAILRHDPALAAAAPASAAPPIVPAGRPHNRRAVLGAVAAVGAAAAALVAVVLIERGHPRRPLHTTAPAAVAPKHAPTKPRHRVKHVQLGTVRKVKKPKAVTRAKPRTVTTPVAPVRAVTPTTTTVAVTRPTPTTTARHIADPVPKPVTISDTFGAGYLDPTIWAPVKDGGDVSIAEQGGQLQLTVGANAVPSGTYNQIDVHVGTQCRFSGDFDARVDYALLEWPAGANIDVGINAIYAQAAVMRDNSSQAGDEYSSWVASGNGVVQAADASGSLRVARVKGVATTYFWHLGSWRKLASSPAAGAVVVGLVATSDGQNAFNGQEVKVAFDNFRVSGVDPDCPAGDHP